jgi:hypothetical protein
MSSIARLLLLVPSLIAGWFIAKQDVRFWIITCLIGLIFLALTCVAGMYVPALRIWPQKRTRPKAPPEA